MPPGWIQTATGQKTRPLSFRVFLSHRYKSAEINLYFFDLFSQVGGELQFKVDEGSKRINMTRLERMVRDADAFVGIYPYPDSPESQAAPADLRRSSRYFRLELDLAVRSGKPAIVFYDRRYRAVLPRVPYSYPYDPQEVTGEGGYPTRVVQADAFETFCRTVEAAKAYQFRAPREQLREPAKVGMLLPTGGMPGAYPPEGVAALQELLEDFGFDCVSIKLPSSVGPEFLLRLWQLDWTLVDVSPEAQTGELVALLHGQFMPMMRIKRMKNLDNIRFPASPLERTLFGGFNVGYVEDLLVWDNLTSLIEGVKARLAAIEAEDIYISSAADARTYFLEAGKRKETVFLSYSGDDLALATPFADALRNRFQKVFDYRRQSIPAGASWFDELVQGVATSAIGVPLLSESYPTRAVCMEEARRMVEQSLKGKMQIFPVSLDDTSPPPVLDSIQYVRAAEFRTPDALVEYLVSLLPSA